jgi:hypothetical protein
MNTITLGGFLSVLEGVKPITINLFNEENLLIITFVKDGYEALEDILEQDPVLKISIKNLQTIDVVIDTTGN